MMLLVLSYESFVYHYMQKLAVVRVYRQSYHVSDDSKITSIIFTAVDHISPRGFMNPHYEVVKQKVLFFHLCNFDCYMYITAHLHTKFPAYERVSLRDRKYSL